MAYEKELDRYEDVPLSYNDVQLLSSRENVAALFSTLHYNTDARVTQTTAAMGFTSDQLRNAIKYIERVALHEDFDSFSVYLFELTRLTVAIRNEIVRGFRNRTGNYLLVLTDDYERLDFVLVERYTQTITTQDVTYEAQSLFSDKRPVLVRPRVLQVMRREPGEVELRVLRRFTYTEADTIAHYEKLLNAYIVAAWSEPFFNNRALFSDYYLTQRFPEQKEWKGDGEYNVLHKAFKALFALYDDAREECRNKPEQVIWQKLFRPVFQELGFTAHQATMDVKEHAVIAYYRLFAVASSSATDEKALALCLTYPWERNLDGKDDQRDSQTPDENPGAAVVTLLDEGEADWAIVTNGIIWRLYAAKAHSRATNYYEINLQEMLALDPSKREEAFRYFWLFFRAAAFIPTERIVEGETRALSLLDDLLLQSDLHARELGERLKSRVFEEIFPYFALGFVNHARQHDLLPAHLDTLEGEERNRLLEPYFTATLTFLYRLLFLFYAESRDLLPVRQERSYYEHSLERLKREIAEKAGKLQDRVASNLAVYSESSTAIYDRLVVLFAAVDKGNSALNVPIYNGGLFMTNPPPQAKDEPAEITVARFLKEHKITDRQLALGLDRMARDVDEKFSKARLAMGEVNDHSHALIFIDYKSLGVRHLGSIYEGLLEFKLHIAPETMAVVEGKRTEEILPYSEAVQQKRRILTTRQGKERKERLYPKGEVYLENDRRERKATGSYYTPDYIVQYIVEQTVGPILKEKLEGLRTVFRDAQKRLKSEQSKAKALHRSDVDPERATYNAYRISLNEIFFDLKVLDPAMGSGHFLVEAVDYVTDQLAKFLNGFHWNPVVYELALTRTKIEDGMREQGVTVDRDKLTDLNLLKRRVLKSCVYGVDLNPMAVELAKVSLWLDCFTLGAPLSFLDHHIKCGNSLIGGDVKVVQQAVAGSLTGWRFSGMLEAAHMMRKVSMLSDVTAQEVKESQETYQVALDELAPYKRVLDVWLSEYFGNKNAKQIAADHVNAIVENEYTGIDKNDRAVIETGIPLAVLKRFFHWELEFPEVFFDEATRKADGGFDAVVGNPPYGDILDELSKKYLEAIERSKTGGRAEVYSSFLLNFLKLVAPSHMLSFILPNTLLDGAQFNLLRETITKTATIKHVRDYRDLSIFKDVSVQTMIITLSRDISPKTYTISQLYWDTNVQEFKLGQLSINFSSDAPWHMQNSVTQKINQPELCLSLEPNIGTCHDAGVDYKWKGMGWQNRGEKMKISDLLFYEGEKRHINDYSLLKGVDIDRYFSNFDNNWLIHDFSKFKTKESVVQVYLNLALVPVKILSRQTSDRIQATIDYGQHVTAKSIHTTLIKATNYNPLYVIAILNSTLISYVYQLQTGEHGRLFAQVKLYDFRKLPIRRINFTTLPAERTRYLDKAKLLYQQCVGKYDQDCVLGFVNHHLTKEPEESDVVHDLLAFLAEEMLRLNKEKRALQKVFLDYFVDAVQVKSDDGKAGIEVLTGKSKLQEFAGDYQKGEEPLTPDALWEIVQKNRSKLNAGRVGLKERVLARYQESLDQVLPLKEQLRRTDALIDQVVYRLYGLTEEEIAIVEGKV